MKQTTDKPKTFALHWGSGIIEECLCQPRQVRLVDDQRRALKAALAVVVAEADLEGALRVALCELEQLDGGSVVLRLETRLLAATPKLRRMLAKGFK